MRIGKQKLTSSMTHWDKLLILLVLRIFDITSLERDFISILTQFTSWFLLILHYKFDSTISIANLHRNWVFFISINGYTEDLAIR